MGVRQAMTARRKTVWVLFALLVVPSMTFFVWWFAIQPLKYGYLVRRVESARTAAEEQAAFRLAADWGRVWEVDRLRPQDAPVHELGLRGDWLLRLEFLPSSPYSGAAYVAYRGVIDTNNLRILWEKKY